MVAEGARSSFRNEVAATVYVDINDPSVIDRVTGPAGDDWREAFYGSIKTAEDVVARDALKLAREIYSWAVHEPNGRRLRERVEALEARLSEGRP